MYLLDKIKNLKKHGLGKAATHKASEIWEEAAKRIDANVDNHEVWTARNVERLAEALEAAVEAKCYKTLQAARADARRRSWPFPGEEVGATAVRGRAQAEARRDPRQRCAISPTFSQPAGGTPCAGAPETTVGVGTPAPSPTAFGDAAHFKELYEELKALVEEKERIIQEKEDLLKKERDVVASLQREIAARASTPPAEVSALRTPAGSAFIELVAQLALQGVPNVKQHAARRVRAAGLANDELFVEAVKNAWTPLEEVPDL